ncbi:MAG: hypothetical protein AAF492_30070, partial [Verrucomicrobiota bacterium]
MRIAAFMLVLILSTPAPASDPIVVGKSSAKTATDRQKVQDQIALETPESVDLRKVNCANLVYAQSQTSVCPPLRNTAVISGQGPEGTVSAQDDAQIAATEQLIPSISLANTVIPL